MPRRFSIQPAALHLVQDAKAATQEYIKLRHCIRDAFEAFLRNLNLRSLSLLEQAFQSHGGEMNSAAFLEAVTKVFPAPETAHATSSVEKVFIQQMACLQLFESVDVDSSGEASWMEFVQFVCAIAEELRLKGNEESGQTFEFTEAEQVALPFRPAVTKCHYDRVFFWPQHPMDSVVIFEEGQTAFNLHFPKTMVRRRRVEGHRQELLSAAFMPAPFQWVVTSGNDNQVCFWDENFNLIKRWTLDHVWTGEKGKVTSAGVLCWCPEIKALYAADHFSEKVRAWRIKTPFDVRASEAAFEPDKRLELKKIMTHTRTVQAICWMSHLKCLATASLDTTVQIFDLVQMKRVYTLQGHKRGLTCLQYCPKNHMLLSCGFDNYICIWDPGAGTLSFTLEGHECSIAGLCPIPNTEYEFMSVDFEGQVRLWDARRLVCLQSFCATDKQAEKNGELEALEPRTICALGQNRVIISGRRMVVFDREAPNPHLTADWQMHAVAFNQKRIEIVTPIKNDLYVWCALTGSLRTLHDNVMEGTITAMTLGLSERRIFVGADDGEINCVNYACGALLKKLTPHMYEVTQITCIPEKILTLSTPEKMLVVHDDNEPDRSVVLKRIDLSGAGAVTQFSFDGRDIIACTSEDWKVVWYNSDFAKEVSNSDGSEVQHQCAVSCCSYFQDAPLLATADADSTVIFWSVPPLRTYSFFSKIVLDIENAKGPFSVSSMALSWPNEEYIFLGMERGMLVCISIGDIVQKAKALRKEILHRKESGEAAEVISGRIFEKMPTPCDSPEYVFQMGAHWVVPDAHRASIDRLVVCRRQPSIVLTLGSDQRVRIWCDKTGEALGTLEQGLPEGAPFKSETVWQFPVNAAEEIARDRKQIENAAEEQVESEDEDGNDSFSLGSSRSSLKASAATPAASPKPGVGLAWPASPAKAAAKATQRPGGLAASQSAPDLRAGAKASGSRPSSAARAGGAGAGGGGAATPSGGASPSRSGRGSPEKARGHGGHGQGQRGQSKGASPTKAGVARMQSLTALPQSLKGSQPRGEEWYAGPYSPGYFAPLSKDVPPMGLPKLQNGAVRPKFTKSKDLVAAARRLSSALGDIDVRNCKDFF